ncbi:glycerol dehydratase reactivase beta/small subunit family protein [Halobacillus sp. Marseille-Q1614]|uniref:glycerol dehydratase reactivase beta/small subunit family protein n=1 Tax=Halobacillus sp. Marseille-Q1614 TaxID=2709134 RepID=UPI001570129A|nr:glycerol dehydratase reactivase beta/small subunit family protein [Halobacillus sp. Marseille-Q1614]
MNKPEIYIVISYDSSLPAVPIQEVASGLEEEGVPYLLKEDQKANHSIELGWNAASMSPLEVGVGIDESGCICIHHRKLNPEKPYLQDNIQNARKLGTNAARLIKGLPLYD